MFCQKRAHLKREYKTDIIATIKDYRAAGNFGGLVVIEDTGYPLSITVEAEKENDRAR